MSQHHAIYATEWLSIYKEKKKKKQLHSAIEDWAKYN